MLLHQQVKAISNTTYRFCVGSVFTTLNLLSSLFFSLCLSLLLLTYPGICAPRADRMATGQGVGDKSRYWWLDRITGKLLMQERFNVNFDGEGRKKKTQKKTVKGDLLYSGIVLPCDQHHKLPWLCPHPLDCVENSLYTAPCVRYLLDPQPTHTRAHLSSTNGFQENKISWLHLRPVLPPPSLPPSPPPSP